MGVFSQQGDHGHAVAWGPRKSGPEGPPKEVSGRPVLTAEKTPEPETRQRFGAADRLGTKLHVAKPAQVAQEAVLKRFRLVKPADQ